MPTLIEDRPELLWKIETAARALNVSRSKAYEMAARGEIPGVVRLGAMLRIHRPTLEQWLEEQAHTTTAA